MENSEALKAMDDQIGAVFDRMDKSIRAMDVPESIRVLFWTSVFQKVAALTGQATRDFSETLPPAA